MRVLLRALGVVACPLVFVTGSKSDGHAVNQVPPHPVPCTLLYTDCLALWTPEGGWSGCTHASGFVCHVSAPLCVLVTFHLKPFARDLCVFFVRVLRALGVVACFRDGE